MATWPLRTAVTGVAGVLAACATSGQSPAPLYRDIDAPTMRTPQPGDIVEDTSAREQEYQELNRLAQDLKARGALGPDLDVSEVVEVDGPRHECPVHGVDLEIDTVPIVYGLVMIDEAEASLSAVFFPLARTEYLGGCVLRRAKEARVRFCPRCRQEQREVREGRRSEGR